MPRRRSLRGIYLYIYFPFFFCELLVITSNGLAKKIDEYVPKNIPAVSIIAKIFVLAGPKNTRASNAIITVDDVAIERV